MVPIHINREKKICQCVQSSSNKNAFCSSIFIENDFYLRQKDSHHRKAHSLKTDKWKPIFANKNFFIGKSIGKISSLPIANVYSEVKKR